MKINWQQLTVVLTGAYGGLGQALAEELDQRGASLVLVGRDPAKLQALNNSLQNPAHTVSGDITDADTLTQVRNWLSSAGSRQHMLINNAALSHAGFLSQVTAVDLQHMLAVNLTAPMLWTQALMPWLKAAEQGLVINVGSSFGGIGYPGFTGYCASKSGLRGFTQALNRELHGSAVRASYLAPRAMSTAINSAAVDDLNEQLGNHVDQPKDIARQMIKAIEQQREERFFGWPEKLFVKLNAWFPGVVSKAIGKDQSTIQSILNKEVNS
jgi:short-subunit dehydrogenase